jgi:two-component system CheB/CheR fusion protein
MVELLSKHTQMKVMLADNSLQVKANCVYVIPPSVNIFIIQGKLYLKQQDRKLGFAFPINSFFRSLSVYKRERYKFFAVKVINK